MPILDFHLGRLHLKSSPRYNDLIARIPGFRYDRTADCWTAAAKFPIALAARGVLGDALELTEEAVAWAERRKMDAQYAEQARTGLLTVTNDERIYPFQRAGVSFLTLCERVLMADSMGTGKGVMGAFAVDLLSRIDRPSPFPLLVVCTTSMTGQWKHELKKWANLDATILRGTAPQRAKQFKEWDGQALILNWDLLRRHSRLASYGSVALKEEEKEPGLLNEIEWATVIADEAHRAKDPRAKQTRALWAVSEEATYRWALTGTPIANRAEDIWSILHFLEPEAWPNRSKWAERYILCGMSPQGYFETYGYNIHTEAEMQASIRPHFIRRTKEEVLPQLPPKIYRQIFVEMGAKQAKAYRTLAKEMIAQLDSGILVADSSVVQNTRLGQIASAMPVIEDDKVVALEQPSSKVDCLLDILDESDEQIVVFSESRLLIELCARVLEKNKISFILITGKISAEDRTQNVATFQAGNARVALCTLGAGSEGITLHAASKLVFLQRSFSMVQNLQGADRIHRIGQESESVEIIDVLSTGTTDIARFEISSDKEGVANQLYNDPFYVRKALLG